MRQVPQHRAWPWRQKQSTSAPSRRGEPPCRRFARHGSSDAFRSCEHTFVTCVRFVRADTTRLSFPRPRSESGFARHDTALRRIKAIIASGLGLVFEPPRNPLFLFGSTTGPSAAGVYLDFPAPIGTKGAS